MALASTAGAGTVIPQPPSGDPLPDLTAEQLELFEAGKVLYTQVLNVENGLGPLFNQESCGNCHNNPVGGPGGEQVTRFGFIDSKTMTYDPLEELGGSLLQHSSIDPGIVEVVPEEANVEINRVTNGAIAYGLVEAIPDDALHALELNAPINPTSGTQEVSGRVHWVTAFEDGPMAPLRAGRFGWKAQVATMLTFSADAALNEMGLTNEFLMEDSAPNGNVELLEQFDTVADPEDVADEDGLFFIDRVTHFQRFLGIPPQTPRNGMIGEDIFMAIGCGDCHVPSFTTSNNRNLEPALRNKTIHPYGDFLLHNMGALGDQIVQGDAGGDELKTPPLWDVNRRNDMLHDGRISGGFFDDRIQQVVEWHATDDSDALEAAQRYLAGLTSTITAPGIPDVYPSVTGGLDDEDRAAVVRFLESLGQREFNFDGPDDTDVDLLDFFTFHQECWLATGVTPEDDCAIADLDQDGDVDHDDFAGFLLVYDDQAPIQDCNDNGAHDLIDILDGVSTDNDFNGLPDECVPCTGDLTADFVVDSGDLALLLGFWGTPGCFGVDPCIANLNNDPNNAVNAADLAILLGAWGECE